MPKKQAKIPPFMLKTTLEIDMIVQPNNEIDFSMVLDGAKESLSFVYGAAILELINRHQPELKILFNEIRQRLSEGEQVQSDIPKHLLN